MSKANHELKDWLTRRGGLATRLRDMRAQAGIKTDRALAQQLGWRDDRLNKLLNGTKVPSVEEVESIAAVCNASPDVIADLRALVGEAVLKRTDFRKRQKDGQAEVQRSYNELVEQTSVVRYFEVAYIPGFLQTPEYARRVFEEQVALHEGVDDVEEAVDTRRERQQLLYDRSKRFELLMTEAVLRFVLPSVDDMRAQLDRLQTAIGVPNVRFGIIPFGVPIPITPQGPIQLYDDVAAVEGYLGEEFLRAEDSKRLARVFDLLWEEAVEGDAARRLIVAAQKALPAD